MRPDNLNFMQYSEVKNKVESGPLAPAALMTCRFALCCIRAFSARPGTIGTSQVDLRRFYERLDTGMS